jgi:hypothetical protein
MVSEDFSLRCYCYLDRMQPQYAAFVGTVTQGDLPTEGMASLYIEMSPGNEVFRTVDIAVKATEARPGAQIVEREFGMFEVHSHNQAAVIESGRIVLARLGLKIENRIRPKVASVQLITNVDPYQAQLLNRFRRGSMLVPGQTLLVVECFRRIHQLCLQRGGEESQHRHRARQLGRSVWAHVAVRQRSRGTDRAGCRGPSIGESEGVESQF